VYERPLGVKVIFVLNVVSVILAALFASFILSVSAGAPGAALLVDIVVVLIVAGSVPGLLVAAAMLGGSPVA